MRVPAGHVAPGSAFCTKTKGQDVHVCTSKLSLSFFLTPLHCSVLSRRTAITCRPLDLGLQFSEQTHEHRDKGWVFDFSLDTSAKGNLIVLFLYIEKFKAVLFSLNNYSNDYVSC